MRRYVPLVLAAAFVLTTAATTAVAQDRLDPIAIKPKIDGRDRAKISTEVSERVKKLADAGTDSDQRRAARERLLGTPSLKTATKEFKAVYAETCARELSLLATSEVFETGFDAVMVLSSLNQVNTNETLAAALKSVHAATRLRAVRGLQALHKELAADPKLAKPVLRALGEAGAQETQTPVLRYIYQTIDLGSEAKDDQLADDCARALNAILVGRLERLNTGRRDETVDDRALEAAARYYAGASEAQKKQLIGNLANWLRHAVDRYFAADTAEGYLPTLASLATKAEDAIHEMIKTSKARVPNKKVADALKKAGQKEQAQAALDELQAILKGEPWNLP